MLFVAAPHNLVQIVAAIQTPAMPSSLAAINSDGLVSSATEVAGRSSKHGEARKGQEEEEEEKQVPDRRLDLNNLPMTQAQKEDCLDSTQPDEKCMRMQIDEATRTLNKEIMGRNRRNERLQSLELTVFESGKACEAIGCKANGKCLKIVSCMTKKIVESRGCAAKIQVGSTACENTLTSACKVGKPAVKQCFDALMKKWDGGRYAEVMRGR